MMDSDVPTNELEGSNLSSLPSHWHQEYITPNLIQAERLQKILHEETTDYQHVVIMDGAHYGRSLVLDGKTQSTEMDEFIYHESLVHPSMIAHPHPKNIFIAGGGEGATAREVLKHNTVEKVVMVDIDEKVVSACYEHLPNHHQGAFSDPRTQLIFSDAYKYLLGIDSQFDVAIIDVPDPIEAGPAHKLFTAEFYSILLNRLGKNGIMVVQSGPTGPISHKECFTAVANTIGHVFPTSTTYHVFVPAFGSTWGFTQASNALQNFNISPQDIDKKLADRKITDLKMYDGVAHNGLYSLPLYLRSGMRKERRIISESSPLFVS